MNRECCSMEEVRTIFRIIVEHATAVDRARKPNSVNRSRWWNWIAMLGIWTLAIGLIVYQVLAGAHAHAAWLRLAMGFAVGGLAMMSIGTALMLIDAVRTTRPPLTQHLDHILDGWQQETRLLLRLSGFDVHSLGFVRLRLEIQSSKVSSRLELIGGDSGMKTSLLGVGAVVAALVASYLQTDFSRLSFAVLSVLGLALVAGISIGAWQVKTGARRADFYVGMLALAIHSKEHARLSGNA